MKHFGRMLRKWGPTILWVAYLGLMVEVIFGPGRIISGFYNDVHNRYLRVQIPKLQPADDVRCSIVERRDEVIIATCPRSTSDLNLGRWGYQHCTAIKLSPCLVMFWDTSVNVDKLRQRESPDLVLRCRMATYWHEFRDAPNRIVTHKPELCFPDPELRGGQAG
jgi:hypothetical protein